LLAALGSAGAAWPLAARAQQPNRRPRPVLGYLVTGTDAGLTMGKDAVAFFGRKRRRRIDRHDHVGLQSISPCTFGMLLSWF
jgi:hypothetical protein